MIAITGLAKTIGPKTLFDQFSCNLNPGSVYGLVGSNGAGKSTLMRILSGEDSATDGQVSFPKKARVGFLNQDLAMDDRIPIIDAAMMGDREVYDAFQTIKNDVSRLAELELFIREQDGYTLKPRAAQVLEGLGIAAQYHEQPLSTLSGGYKLRVLLAQILVSKPEVLLLDEPTNHLDILSIHWLEKFLKKFAGCTIVISHDRKFLDNIATHILDIDYGTVTLYTGNYSQFEKQKNLEVAQREAAVANLEREVAHKQAYVDRFRYKASKARQAQSRLKQIEKIEIPEIRKSSRREPHFAFEPVRSSGREVVELKNIHKSYGPKSVLKEVRFSVARGERIAVIGPNGIGKSTLIKILVGEVKPDRGHLKWGFETHPGYFAQEKKEFAGNPDQTAENWLWQFCPTEGASFVRARLGAILFSGDDAKKPLGVLSGGERARLDLARLSLQGPNVLLLDEPTNHLDIEAIDGLIAALKLYEGTLIFVSHDRWFVDQLATRILELKIDGIHDFKGSFAEYLAECHDDHLDFETQKSAAQKPVDAEPSAKQVEYLESKKRKADQRKRETRILRLQEEIEGIEAKNQQIDSLFCSEGFFERTKTDEIARLKSEKDALNERLNVLYEEWQELEG